MARAYHELSDEPQRDQRTKRELTEAEQELLSLLKSRGVPSICDSISKEINYVWAVTSGFKTLAAVGNFYFACGSQTFGYNPAYDFFAAHGMQLALFALQKFIHNENLLVPVLECIHIYSKLHVDGALEFLAIADATEILMKCVRFHDNRHDVISTACQALGSLVMNDLVKETVSSPALVLELLGLVKRYHASQATCRGALVPLGFFVTDAAMTATFVDANGIALTMVTMKRFIKDTELVWHAIGILNGLNAKTLDTRLIVAVFGFTGVSRIVEALALHLDTEEIAVEGFQLLAKLAAHREAYAAINQSKVLDLAYVALFAYAGPQHRHTRLELKKTLYPFQKCTLYDARELSQREQASRADLVLYALFVLCFLLTSVLSLYDHHSSDLVVSVERALVERKWPAPASTSSPTQRLEHSLGDVSSADDVWRYILGPLHETLFQDRWYNGDLFAADVTSQLGVVDRANWLLGGVQLRLMRVRNATCSGQQHSPCYPPYARDVECTSAVGTKSFVDRWSDPTPDLPHFAGQLATYPSSGYRHFVPRLNATATAVAAAAACGPYCQLTKLRDANWIDRAARALFVEFTLYNAAIDAHCAVTLLFEFAATGGVVVTTDVAPVHLDQYPDGVFVFALRFYVEIAALAALGWFAHKQVLKVLRYRWFYFVVPGHVVDAAILGLWVAAIALRVHLHIAASHALLVELAANSAFVSLAPVAQLVQSERRVLAWAAVFMWWRLFRFAKCLKPLEGVMNKFERAESLLRAYAVVLALYIAAFAHAGAVLFPASHASFRTFADSIASMAASLFRRWAGDNDVRDTPVVIFRMLFQLATTFVLLNVAVAILRERFDSDRSATSSAKSDAGASLLVMARKQLEASGMSVYEASLPNKLRLAAARGMAKIQHATREIFAIADGAAELTDLKRVWGLQGGAGRRTENGNGRDDECESGSERLEPSAQDDAQRLLEAAEELDRHLDQQLSYMSMRMEDAMRQLQSFEQLMSVQICEKEALEAEAQAVAAARAAATAPAPEVADDARSRAQEPLSGAQKPTTTTTPAAPPSPEQSALTVADSAAPAVVLLPGAVATADDEQDERGSDSAVDGGLSDDLASH